MGLEQEGREAQAKAAKVEAAEAVEAEAKVKAEDETKDGDATQLILLLSQGVYILPEVAFLENRNGRANKF